ncbi:MAG: rod shape-determining protein [Planctomycetes bacterium]|nr:rod shape-determining protein [Planctomycetota bacterium]
MSEPTKTGDAKKDHGVLYIGIDFGTSRTSVSATNGQRATVLSYVGYPKDVVSRKLLKKEMLFGDEAVENRLALNLYRPLEYGVIKGSGTHESKQLSEKEWAENLKAAKDLLKHAVTLVKPRADELLYGVIGAPAQASVKNQKNLIECAKEVLDSVMICSEPFAVAYGIDRLDDVLVVDIGAGTTDLCRMHGTMPEEGDQITIPVAGDFIDIAIEKNIREKFPQAQLTRQMIKALKEKYSNVLADMTPAIAMIPIAGKPTPLDITDCIRDGCREIVRPITDAIAKLIASFDPDFQDRLKNNVLLAGGGSLIGGLDIAIEMDMNERLGTGHVMRIDEPTYGGANGALKIAQEMPADFWQKLK